MKKILLLVAICLIELASQSAFASCPTGYACMLKDLKQQESVIQTLQQNLIDDYYKTQITEPRLKELQTRMPTYRDLFLFLPRYY